MGLIVRIDSLIDGAGKRIGVIQALRPVRKGVIRDDVQTSARAVLVIDLRGVVPGLSMVVATAVNVTRELRIRAQQIVAGNRGVRVIGWHGGESGVTNVWVWHQRVAI